jgi:DNA-binding PadR family transcriptional regulator
MWRWGARGARTFGLKLRILYMLSRGEMTGAEIIDSIAAISMGLWRPSPGSVYPALKELTEEGYVEFREVGNRKFYRITEKGKNHLAEMGMIEVPRTESESGTSEILESLGYYIDYLMDERDELERNPKLKERLKEIRDRIDQLLR